MNHILLLEDNADQAKILAKWISEKYANWKITVVSNYDESISEITNSVSTMPYTLFLLDIKLNTSSDNRDGYVVAQEIRKLECYYKTPILFLTQIQGEGLYAFSQFHCYNYITKPYTKEVVLGQIEQMLLTDYLSSTIIVSDIDQICHQFFASDIKYVKASGARKEIVLKKSKIITRMRLPEILALSNHLLVQCHKSYLVNPNYITSIDRQNRCLNIDSEILPIGRVYMEQFGFLK